MLPMSQDCPFLITCSVFSKVYLANIHYIEYKYYRVLVIISGTGY